GVSGFLLLALDEVATPGTPFQPLAGVGWVPGSGVDIVSGSTATNVGFFTPSGGSVAAGSSYDLVFLSFATPPARDGSLQIVAGLQLVPEATGIATVVPEPKTAALLGLGLVVLARRRRRA
ncbi:MAG TPA: PEP-CTERM sorting domain-containing protein, partial [Myxococcota bacterium]|nr:PEP-CTERM sorting domain-containing protein [Myxococcota bacterium]